MEAAAEGNGGHFCAVCYGRVGVGAGSRSWEHDRFD